ncbi:MAG: hypothetical protein RLZZ352_511 [Pseudomonadota bacterium]
MFDRSLAKLSQVPSLMDSADERVAKASTSQKPLNAQQFKTVKPYLGEAEAELIEVYRLIGAGQHRQALTQAERLVNKHPNFQLAQLVLGDLFTLQTRPVKTLGDVPNTKSDIASSQLSILRDESRRRIRALVERPPEGFIPSQFLALSSQSRHAIAIDASRSRLYLFENVSLQNQPNTGLNSPRLRLINDFYISVGLSGIEKSIEGDKRTPLGVYYITSNLNPGNLPDLYGVGALPINYPNPLDNLRGKTGGGIWLHGTPREQFVRAPQASDGCVVLSNPDLERVIRTVQVRTTPVVIASELNWIDPAVLRLEHQVFQTELERWRTAKASAELGGLRAFYSDNFRSQGRDLSQWWPKIESEIRHQGSREIELKDISVLQWHDSDETMVVTFGEIVKGQSRGSTRRQYWMKESDGWKIIFEGAP